MSHDDIWSRIVKVVRDTFDDEALDVTRATSAQDVAAWDSLTNVELVVALQEEFGIRFNTGEIAAFKNAGELANAITAKVARAGR
jgi:acyl carrier protein